MKKLITLGCLLLLVSASWGLYPFSKSTGCRPISLGSAYAGLSDDGAGLFFNPAGLTTIPALNLISMYTQPASNTSFILIGGAMPVGSLGIVGLGLRNRVVANVAISSEVADFTDREFLVSFGRKVDDQLSLAADLQFLSKGISKDIAGFTGANGSGGGLTLGLKYSFFSWLEFGLIGQNLATQINYQDGTKENVPANVILGVSNRPRHDTIVNCDLSKKPDEPVLAHLGAEWQLNPLLAVRGGLDQTAKNQSEAYNNLTAGMGIKISGISFDYALYRQGDPSESMTHYFSFGYAGAAPKKRGKAELLPVRRLHFKDVPEGYWAKEPIELLASLGIINYYPDQTYRPEQTISRSELIMLLVRAKEYELPAEPRQVFSDVPTTFWGADYVQAAYDNKLVYGYPDRTFRPRQATERAETATLITRFGSFPAKELPPGGVSPYSDLPATHWSLGAVLAAKDEAIWDYMKGNKFFPSQNITRAELADILYRTKFAQERIKATKFED
jgi:hypothetical protein